MSTLERAIALAALAHEGQQDKAGEPYILHPLRVMLRLRTPTTRIVGVLHDILEDTSLTAERLRVEGFGPDVVDALEAVTRRPGESYDEFIARAGRHPIGREVKLADLADNSDVARLPAVTAHDTARIEKYERARRMLAAAESDGPPGRRGDA